MDEVMEYSIDPASIQRELSPLINFTDSDWMPEPYVVPRTISSTHNQPRFGHTNDFNALIDGSEEQVKEYALGVLVGAMIILGVAILWFFVIVTLKIVGQKRVGFLAGRFVRPTSEEDSDEGVEVVMAGGGRGDDGGDPDEGLPADYTGSKMSASENKKFNRSVWIGRAVFILAGLMVIISGGVFYGKGVAAFKNSLDEVRGGLGLVQVAAYKAIELTDNVLMEGEEIDQEMDPTREVATANGGEICGLDSETSQQIRELYDGLSQGVDDLKEMLSGSLDTFGNDLRNLVTLTENIDKQLDSADIIFYVLVVISAVLIGLILCMLAGVFFAWKGLSNCFTRCIQYAIIWPLFVLLLVLNWIFATLFLVLSLAGADFCVSPDQITQNVINTMGGWEGIIFGFVMFYVSGCTIMPEGEGEIVEIMVQLKLVLNYVHRLTEVLGNMPIGAVAAVCDLSPAEATALSTLVDLTHSSTHLLNRAVVGLREVLACETFNPIYQTFVHKAFCVEGVSGMSYIFATSLCISIFSMIMIMFRAAMYPIKESAAIAGGKSVDEAVEVVHYEDEGSAAGGGDDSDGDRPNVY